MCGVDEDWVSAAMTDDKLVVDLLVRLQTTAPPPHRKTLPLDWSVRQRRSRSLSLLCKEKDKASPSTPLTWSGATSHSGGSGGGRTGGYEESSAGVTASRSKDESEKTNSKRPRKKKTLSELREEESTLLKERRELKKELSKQRMHLEKQKEINEKLKRMKAQLQPLQDQESPSTLEASVSYQIVSTIDTDPTASRSHQERRIFPEGHSKSIIPDLNIPFEEEAPCPEAICGVC